MSMPVSYSALAKYEQCPHQYLRVKVKKDVVEDFSHPTTLWGREVHKAFEAYFKYNKPLDDKFDRFQNYVKSLAAISGDHYIELKLAMNEDNKIVGWLARDVAYRAILDFLAVRDDVAFLIDHKAGKVRPTKQLHFAALLVFAAFPKVNTIKAAFFWVKGDTYTKYTFSRADIDALWGEFENTLVAMEESFETNSWPKRQTGLCPWCPVADCEFRT